MQNPEVNLHTYDVVNEYTAKEAKIYNGEKTSSSISCTGKAGQLPIKG